MLPVGFPYKTIDGDYTFRGAIEEFFDNVQVGKPISAGWNEESTFEKNVGYVLCKLILSNFDEWQKYKALKDFINEDFQDIVTRIKAKGLNEDSDTPYRARMLFWRVYKAGLDNLGFEQKIFWDKSDFYLGSNLDDLSQIADETAKKLLIPRSLSIEEERRIINRFKTLDPIKTRGQEVGLFLMFFLGLRNNEACGLNYGDITNVVYSDTSRYAAVITKTSSFNSRDLKLGGKTKNAVRIVPIIGFFYKFLEERKKEISKQIDNGSLVLSQEVRSINDLPISCCEFELTKRCTSSDLSKESSNFFQTNDTTKAISVLSELLASMDDISKLGEKDPTTYLLRRNFATHIYGLGLDESELQYLMGHEIEAVDTNRSHLSNIDRLAKMHEAFDLHPFWALYDIKYFKDAIEEKITFQDVKKNEKILVNVVCEEPQDCVKIQFQRGEVYRCNVHKTGVPIKKYKEDVNITKAYSQLSVTKNKH